MKSFFNLDNPFFSFMSRVSDIVILNVLFIICSIPVFTTGASLTAMSYVTLKMKEGEEGYIARSFFRSFKKNFKQSTLVWLVMLVFAAVLYIDWQLLRTMEGAAAQPMRVFILIGALLWLMLLLYLFPMIARYENTTMNMVRNAVLLMLANAPKAILMVIVIAVCIALTFFNSATLVWGILIWLMVGFAVISFLNSTLQIKIFHKIEPDEEGEDVSEGELRP